MSLPSGWRLRIPDVSNDWVGYVVDELRRRGHAPSREQVAIVAGRLRAERLVDAVDPWKLAVALDVYALRWSPETAEAMLSLRALVRPLNRYAPGDDGYWRYVWWSRFAASALEAEYLRAWLAAWVVAAGAVERDARTAGIEGARRRLAAMESRLRNRAGAVEPFLVYDAVAEMFTEDGSP